MPHCSGKTAALYNAKDIILIPPSGLVQCTAHTPAHGNPVLRATRETIEDLDIRFLA